MECLVITFSIGYFQKYDPPLYLNSPKLAACETPQSFLSNHAMPRSILAKGGTIVGQNHVKTKMAHGLNPYAIVIIGGPSRDRTVDLLIKSQLLYQLS